LKGFSRDCRDDQNYKTKAKNAQKDGVVKHLQNGLLSDMIDVGHEVGWIQLDVKNLVMPTRDFRNIIHQLL
jgi:hypothetical protein